MEIKSKTATYVGFCIRAGKCRAGVNAIATLKKANLILLCKSASQNTVEQVNKLAKSLRCQVLVTKDVLLEQWTFKAGVKAIAITDKSLADAIYQNRQEDFIL